MILCCIYANKALEAEPVAGPMRYMWTEHVRPRSLPILSGPNLSVDFFIDKDLICENEDGENLPFAFST